MNRPRGCWAARNGPFFGVSRCPWLGVGAVLGFVRALGDFGATLMVAGNIPGRTRTAALALYDATTLGEAARARTLVAVLGLVAVVALWFSGRAKQSGAAS